MHLDTIHFVVESSLRCAFYGVLMCLSWSGGVGYLLFPCSGGCASVRIMDTDFVHVSAWPI